MTLKGESRRQPSRTQVGLRPKDGHGGELPELSFSLVGWAPFGINIWNIQITLKTQQQKPKELDLKTGKRLE